MPTKPNAERREPNAERRKPNAERREPNGERRKPNAERRTEGPAGVASDGAGGQAQAGQPR